jgi:hypothetical protein
VVSKVFSEEEIKQYMESATNEEKFSHDIRDILSHYNSLDELLSDVVSVVERTVQLWKGDPKNGYRKIDQVEGQNKLTDQRENKVQVTLSRLKDDVDPEDIGTAIHEPVDGEGELHIEAEVMRDSRIKLTAQLGFTDIFFSEFLFDPNSQELKSNLDHLIENNVIDRDFRLGVFGVV